MARKTAKKVTSADAKPVKVKTPTKRKTKEAVHTPKKLFWGVFNQSMKRVALFQFNEKKQAEQKASALSQSGKSPHFVQRVKDSAIDA